MVRKIGLTGGIASGKSKVAELLAGLLHCSHIDADTVCRNLLEPKEEGWEEFSRVFGGKYFSGDGTVNRPLLRTDLFADAAFRDKVNAVIHPLVKKTITAHMDRILASEANSRVLVEVPLLYEVGWEDLFDTVIVVYADFETCLQRLMVRDGTDRKTAATEMESQMPMSDKVMRADHVIDNSGTLIATRNQVEHLAYLLENNDHGVEKKLDSEK